jgi:hypothetical protein
MRKRGERRNTCIARMGKMQIKEINNDKDDAERCGTGSGLADWYSITTGG